MNAFRVTSLAAAVLLALACGAAASASEGAGVCAAASSAPPIPSPTRMFDEYGDITFDDEKARLDNFAVELWNLPEAKGYIIAYGGRRAREGEARQRMERAKRYLMTVRKVPDAQLVTIDGGHREDLTVELYIVPPGMSPPAPYPTVDPREVKIIPEGPKRATRRPRRRS